MNKKCGLRHKVSMIHQIQPKITKLALIALEISVINRRHHIFPRRHFHSKNIADFAYLFEDEVEVGAGVGGGDAKADAGGYYGGGWVADYDHCQASGQSFSTKSAVGDIK